MHHIIVPSSTPSTPNTPMNTGVEQTVEGAKGFSSLGAGLTHCDVVTKSKGHTILQVSYIIANHILFISTTCYILVYYVSAICLKWGGGLKLS